MPLTVRQIRKAFEQAMSVDSPSREFISNRELKKIVEGSKGENGKIGSRQKRAIADEFAYALYDGGGFGNVSSRGIRYYELAARAGVVKPVELPDWYTEAPRPGRVRI